MTVRRFGWLLCWWLACGCIGVRAEGLAAAPYVAKPEGLAFTHMKISPLNSTAEGEPPPAATVDWTSVQLPDRWGKTKPEQGGSVWYEAVVHFQNQPQAPWAVYLPRVIMNAEVWVNGVLVGRAGQMTVPYTRHWNTPLLFQTPATVWQPGNNLVHIRVVALPDGSGGLAPPQLGRADIMASRHARQVFWQNDLVYAANISVMALGLFVLAVWLRKRERADYGYFSAGALLWGAANFNMTVRTPPLPNAQWELMVYIFSIWSLLFLCLFTLRFARKVPPWLERSVLAYCVVCALFLLLSGEIGSVTWGRYWLLPVLVLGAWAMWQLAVFVRHTKSADFKILGLVEALTLALGLHDWLIQMGRMPFETAYGLPFAAPLLLGALAWLIAGDYARTQQDLASLNSELTDRVRQKEQALRDSFAKVALLERAQAISNERQRIMRDMHDGVGLHLSSALRQVQGGAAPAKLIEQSLRDSLDHLKLTVDSMNFREGDVAGLLGGLRYRLAPRLQAAGLSLDWQVAALPVWSLGSIDHLGQLQFIVFEAISNALQHAQASALLLSATHEEATIVLRIEDNGRGLALTQEGKGLTGMRQRARSIGADIRWENLAQGGCRVCVRLPLEGTLL
ncbi:MAG: hypothetical protein RJB34_1554 [Pseudomonadota bacterium]|jgi:signal transduction histidine kinase